MQTTRRSNRYRAGVLACSVLAAALTAGLAQATEPDNQPSPTPVQEELIPDLPEFPTVWQETGPLQLFAAPPFGPDDKGGTYTDMGLGQPAHLTPWEQAILELGRAAVEASRAAGTLEMPRRELQALPMNEDAARQKQESLLNPPASTPVLGTGSPADMAASGSTTAPVPVGPFPLTQAELEKLSAVDGQSGVVILESPVIEETPQGRTDDPAKTADPAAEEN